MARTRRRAPRPLPASRLGSAPGLLAGAVLLAAAPSGAVLLECTAEPAGAPPFEVELVTPTTDGVVTDCRVELVGRVGTVDVDALDVYVIVDSSGSTAGASGEDVDGDGVVGQGDWRTNSDPGDSTLAAELEAVRRALTVWRQRDIRVAILEYSAVIPIPPGEPQEQGRIRTVQGLTGDHDAVRAALDVIAAAGSVGATDYGGALLELAAEYDRSGDPARRPIAFFLSDGKPTFPRYPYDTNEAPDVDWALEGAAAVAARGLPVHALEIGVFDDVRVLESVAGLTGGTVLPGLTGAGLLDALASFPLDGFVSVRARNETTGEESQATLEGAGTFRASLTLADGPNELTFTAVLTTEQGEWTISCPVSLIAVCLDRLDVEIGRRTSGPGGGFEDGAGGGGDDGGEAGRTWRPRLPGGENAGGVGRRYRRLPDIRHPWTAERIARWVEHPCITLGDAGPFGDACDEALRQLTALLISIEEGELSTSCPLDPDQLPDHRTVAELIDDLERELDRGRDTRCADLAALAALVTGGGAFGDQPVGPDPTGPHEISCTLVRDGTDVEVTVAVESPAPGATVGSGEDCTAGVRVAGAASAGGTGAHDVYFVVDSSGSTAGDSGRDLDGDGQNETTLEAELEAVRAFVSLLDPATVRVALIEFSAVIPIPPGEPSEQGRIRTVQGLTADFDAFFRGLDTIRTDGSVGATDYGGALNELAAEYDRNGDPTRGQVAFFLSDGKPTFPRFPYDTTETPDVDWAMQGAGACAARAITVNTYEVGVFDDLSVLLDVASTTGGTFYPTLSDGAIVEALPGSSLVGIQEVIVTNLLTGETVVASLAPDGSFSADVEIVPGENELLIRVVSDGGEEVVECSLPVIGDCSWPPCAARSPDAWRLEDCP